MSANNVKDASFYADFGTLSSLKRDARANDPAALRAAAQQFESLFTNMMLKSMRAASFGDALTGSSDVDFYQGMFDQQLAVQMSKGKGLGLADMLVQQLSRSGLVSGADADANAAITSSVGRALRPTSAESGNAAAAKPDLQENASINWPPASPQDFVQQLLPHAQKAAEQLGVDATTLVAHAALETGWGKHVPCNADGSSSFNLFGIKTGSEWQGKQLDAGTLEFEQGGFVKKVERFRAYDSPADCFADYAQLLGGARRYAPARNAGSDSLQFAEGLQQGGYATDPAYASKLHAVANTVQAMKISPAQVPATPADT